MDAEVKRQIDEFFGNYPVRQFKEGQIVIFAGEAPTGVFYLLQGNVRQYDVINSGEEVVVNVFRPPAFFPMGYAINRRPNEYFYGAATQVTARVAPVGDVLEFVRGHPDVVFDLLARVYNGIDGLLRRQVYLMNGAAGDRLAYELLICCRRSGELRADGSCVVRLTETELAARAGLTRETVSRRLQILKDQGLVQVAVKSLTITDVARLEKLLDHSS